MITVVVPCYNEEQALPYFIPEIQQVAKTLETQYQVALEVLLVNDGSKDGTLSLMRTYAGQYKNVRYLSFSRNFGKEAAIYAGLEHAKGDYVAIMDADMQDPPALLPQMYEILRDEPYDSVATRRVDRAGEPLICVVANGRKLPRAPKLFCPHLLQAHQPHFRCRHCGRRPGLPADEAGYGGRHPVHEGVQPLLQGHFRLGGLPHQVAAL